MNLIQKKKNKLEKKYSELNFITISIKERILIKMNDLCDSRIII